MPQTDTRRRTKPAARAAVAAAPRAEARLEVRVTTELHAMLKHAATLQGRSLSDFIVTATREAAQRAVAQAEIIQLSVEDQRLFANALLSPPPQNAALVRTWAHRRRLLR